ncbi:hypothetical protein MJ572_05585 [Escherichia coli]|nr:hypothetical protein MJ572_05585 [Escherichia coli]
MDSNGSVFYSRNGQFKLDENRNLVNSYEFTADGLPGSGTRRLFSKGESDQYFDSEYPDGSENYHHGVDAESADSSDPLPSVNAF